MNNNVTIFKSLYATSTGFNRDVFFVLERIRNGASKSTVEQVRKAPNDDIRSEIKKQLPVVCFSGTFRYRSISGLIKHSGLLVLDFDKIPENEFEKTKQELKNNKYTFALWLSPSGNGLKCLVRIPPEENNHKRYYSSIKEFINSEYLDDSGKDVSRGCLESYDPDLYINPDSEIWTQIDEPDIEDIGVYDPVIPITSENRIVTNLVTWWESKYGATKGSRNSNVFKLAAAFNDFGINKNEATNILSNYKSDGFNEKEIQTIIKSAYRNTAQFGTKFFEDTQSKEQIEKLIRAGKQQKDIIKDFPDIPHDSIETYVSNVKDNLDLEEFWYYDDKNKIKLSIHKYKFWLEQNNFFKYYPMESSNTFTFIKKEQNLLEETSEKRIKDFVLNYILNKPNIGYGPYDFMAGNGGYFRYDFLSLLDTTNVELKEDTKDLCYLYYKNCVLEVSKDSVKEIDYIDINGYVWKRQIIDREFKKFDHHDSVYRKFIWLISGKSVPRYNSLKSVIGYLLHSFKTSANNKAIIFNDETISENPNGGSGKGLFWNALKNMKKVSAIDGKTFEFTKSFPYQTVSTDTQILVFDDVKKNFNFESLFSLITEGITLEYKGQDAIQIPVEKSPKILITTNYTLGGIGGSHERRKFEIEMSAYFNNRHTPLDEFGHMLFADWDEEEWLRFDNYMVNCEQYYLKNGLVSHAFNNLETRKLIKETSYEFYEWANDGNLPLNERLDKSIYYQRFIDEYQDFKKWLTQRRFSKWLEVWGEFNAYKVIDGRTNSMRWISYETDTEENKLYDDDAPF